MYAPVLEAGHTVANRYRPLLLAAAIYDCVLGLAFLFFAGPISHTLGFALAADPVYVQLAAGLIGLMGLGFYFAWREPLLNRDIIVMGAVGKAFYILLAIVTQLRGTIPHPVFLLLAGIDLVFFAVFVQFLRETKAVRAAVAAVIAERSAT
jgi:hypothetical protein